jgi:hypothetical protein
VLKIAPNAPLKERPEHESRQQIWTRHLNAAIQLSRRADLKADMEAAAALQPHMRHADIVAALQPLMDNVLLVPDGDTASQRKCGRHYQES